MASKKKDIKSDALLEEKELPKKSKLKRAISKLKKLRDKIAGEKDIKSKKLKKQKAGDGKKKKIKSLKQQVSKLVKKEKEVIKDLKKLKEEKEALEQYKNDQLGAGVTTGDIETGEEISLDEIFESGQVDVLAQESSSDQNGVELKSVDHPAKAAIVYVRKLTDVTAIDGYVAEEERPTVLKAAVSRKNRLEKNPV